MATEVDNVNSGALGTLLAVGACATLGIALVVTALVRTEVSEEAAKKEVGADRPYRDLVAEQTAKMAAPAAYVDRASGLVSLPIERAMELTVSGLIKDPSSATPVAAGGSGGSGGTAGAASAAAAGGSGGAGGSAGTPSGGAKPADEATHAEPGEHGKKIKPTPAGDKNVPKPMPATPGVPGVPGAPAPAAPAPATPAPAAPAAPAPNGQ